MHLKTLTVRGFKSFASATTFEFEPGVTAVVGPNGSGKSNVVDALAWVMGEQGAKTLRGGKMEDVIFAGTSGRAPLGRAQVSLTIDNADGALPIDYSEVTISRTLFRSGGSEYAINGASCRLLDIQELLSDSGLGREMHVIVGQGQLDKILHATPEDRRGFIEEASGILKHRRRKEKTLRKLDAMATNLNRLTDLTAEIRRQLTPLGKQAEVARRAQTVQFEVRDARARLLADELVTLRTAYEKDAAGEALLGERKAAAEVRLRTGRERQTELETLAAQAAPALSAARDTWYQLSTVHERLRALAALANDRRAILGAEPVPAPGRDPEQLEQQALRMRDEEAAMAAEVREREADLEGALVTKAEAERAATAENDRLTALARAQADKREGLARLAGQVGAARSRWEATEAELGRLRAAASQGVERRSAAASEFTALESQVAGVEAGEENLDAEYEEAVEQLEAIRAEIEGLNAARLAAERERDALTARREALAVGLARADGAQALLDAGNHGVLGSIVDQLNVQPGYEGAVAAALGPLAAAVAVADHQAALAALAQLRNDDGGRVSLVLASAVAQPGQAVSISDAVLKTAPGAVRAFDVVDADAPVHNVVAQLLRGIVVVSAPNDAEAILRAEPQLTVVTKSGDVFTAVSAAGGSVAAPSQLELQAAIAEADEGIRRATAEAERAVFALAGAANREREASQRSAEALERLHDSDARLSSVAERLGQLGSVLRAATGESERLAQQLAAAELNLVTEEQTLHEVTERLALAQETPDVEEPSSHLRDELALAASGARTAEMEARLALRSAEEGLKATANRAAGLERAAAAERAAKRAAQERARRREYQARKAQSVARGAEIAASFAEVSLEHAATERDAATTQRGEQDAELAQLRAANEELVVELTRLMDAAHRDELARTAQSLKIEAVENRAIEDLGLTAEHLIAEYGPHTLVPAGPSAVVDKWAALRAPVDEDGQELREGTPFVRAEQEKRLRRAEKDLAALGKVNPLALEEFAALEERSQFLSAQLEDLKSSRKDLLDIIKEVDQRVEQVFSSAFADTAAQFERVFSRLFPGGEGRLILTDPTDMLTTGIEVEARPAGKRIKRLSLLSGGERSLTAVALLVAIFKARPSPFYVMDEVEAALDDTNLGRLITIFEELRESSQLIIITHQKRTMEVADALYGVSMRGDGVSKVISQRLQAS